MGAIVVGEPIGRGPGGQAGRHRSERAGRPEPAGRNAANQAAGVQQSRDRAVRRQRAHHAKRPLRRRAFGDIVERLEPKSRRRADRRYKTRVPPGKYLTCAEFEEWRKAQKP